MDLQSGGTRWSLRQSFQFDLFIYDIFTCQWCDMKEKTVFFPQYHFKICGCLIPVLSGIQNSKVRILPSSLHLHAYIGFQLICPEIYILFSFPTWAYPLNGSIAGAFTVQVISLKYSSVPAEIPQGLPCPAFFESVTQKIYRREYAALHLRFYYLQKFFIQFLLLLLPFFLCLR